MAEPVRTSSGASDEVRQRLIAAALGLFTRKGYAATTVREIVEAAGVTKPTLYYYFQNKEGLFLGIVNDALTENHLLLDRFARGSGSPRQRLIDLCDALCGQFIAHLDVVRIVNALHYGPPQGAPPFDHEAIHQKIHAIIQDLIREGIRRGEFRAGNPEEMTWAVLGVLNITLETQLCHPERSPGRDGMRRLLAIIFEGLAVPATGRQGVPR